MLFRSLLDPYWLFAGQGTGQGEEAPVCAIPADDPWMSNILRPIIEAAGYRVRLAMPGEAPEADLTIASANRAECVPGAGEVIRIRTTLESRGDGDDSIYRYDRAALLSELGRRARPAKG